MKRNLHVPFILSALAITGLFQACSDEVDLNAPYDSKTVVFGLLDAKADTQFIKINKTFLGDGNNLEYAAIRDSSEYDFADFEAEVEEYLNGNLTATFPLDSITIKNKDINGIFYAPEQTVYYFATPNGLNEDATYRLNVDFNNGEEDVRAFTDMVEDPPTGLNENSENIDAPPAIPLSTYRMILANQTTLNTGVYSNFTFKWNSTPGAGRYEAKLRFYYTERIYTDDTYSTVVSEELKYIDWILGTFTTQTLAGNEDFQIVVNGESFYRIVESKVPEVEDGVFMRRHVGYFNPETSQYPCFDFLLSVANGELTTYLEVTEPVTGLIQERPTYTNVENGLGLFASKLSQGVYQVRPSNYTVQMLQESPYTSNRGFCTLDPAFQDQNYYCGP